MHTQPHVVGLLLRVTTHPYGGIGRCRGGAIGGGVGALAPTNLCAPLLEVATSACGSVL